MAIRHKPGRDNLDILCSLCNRYMYILHPGEIFKGAEKYCLKCEAIIKKKKRIKVEKQEERKNYEFCRICGTPLMVDTKAAPLVFLRCPYQNCNTKFLLIMMP